jgi:molecular chaperone DnaJ
LRFEDAVFGTKQEIELSTMSRCDRCNGDGCEPGTFRGKCPACGGVGELRATRNTILGTVMTSRPCAQCGGSGEAPTDPCTTCRGQGRVPKKHTVTIDVPPGVDDGTTLRLRGEGEGGVRGGADGDLFVRINVRPHEFFARRGDDLLCELTVPLSQAILGASIPVQTLDGTEELEIVAGTQHGDVLKLRARGVPRLDGRGRGDLLVHVAVEIPRRLKPEERELFERVAEIRGEAVSDGSKGIFRRIRDGFLGQ